MSMTDPIADLLTRIRNAQSAGKPTVGVGASKLKLAILKVLKDEGYIGGYGVDVAGAKSTLSIELKYHDGRPVIDRIERISRPGLRIYRGKDELPKVLGGLGVAVISTPKGIMSDAQARAAGATILSELEENTGVGQRQYRAEDLEGHRWMFATPAG